MITVEQLQSLLDQRFHGRLTAGSHQENGECCALELLSVAQKIPWTDSPQQLRCWDLRPLNDIAVADTIRTAHMIPVLAAYANSLDWPAKRQKAVTTLITIKTVSRIVSALSHLPVGIAEQCRDATTLSSALTAVKASEAACAAAQEEACAAWAAQEEAEEACAAWAQEEACAAWTARAGSWAAKWARAASLSARASEAAAAASWAAARAESEKLRESIFINACKIWLEAANATR